MRDAHDDQVEFSAAFSGGPIEGQEPMYSLRAMQGHFPLLLAAAPLKGYGPAEQIVG